MHDQRLDERYVQHTAVNWLAAYYQEQPGVRGVIAAIEAVVHPETRFGWGRADGLIAVRGADGGIRTVALEAKSAKTLFNLSQWHSDERWIFHAFASGGIGGGIALGAGWLLGMGLWMWLLAITMFVLSGFLYLWLADGHPRHRRVDVIQQVRSYPAHERWIAISADAYDQLNSKGQDDLRSECRKVGIGLIMVDPAGEIAVHEVARTQRLPAGLGDPLSRYARGERIRQQLLALRRL
jgi:hypothetical protein